MIVDNFDLLQSVMKFSFDDEFYFVQVLIRGKDGHNEPGVNGSNKNRLIKFYTIRSVEELKNKKEEIVSLCHLFNARAYIHPTKRSFVEVGSEFLKVSLEMYFSNPQGLKTAYSTSCGKFFIKDDKKWIIDIDANYIEKINEISEFIETECEPRTKLKIQYIVPTVHGAHLITTPFDSRKFEFQYPDIDIHKNNPTLLYYKTLD